MPFVYSQKDKEDIWAALRNIIENILIKLNIQNTYECNNTQEIGHQIRSYYGFEGPSNYGSRDAIIMIHPKKIHDHKEAIQLICYFFNGEIKVGWDIGQTIRKNKSILNLLNLPKPSLVKINSFNEIIKELEKILPLVNEANNKLIDINSKGIDFDTTLDFPDIEQVEPILDTTLDFKKISDTNKNRAPKKHSSKNNKPDWEIKTKFERKLGFRGEEIVLKFEREQLTKEGREDLANEIKQVSLEDDSLGYDILSFYKDGSKKFIEVKSTVANVHNFKKFYLSQNEYEKLESSKNNCIYLVLKANTKNPIIKEILSISELEKQEKCKKQIEKYSINLQL